jgi:hypothetical protein
MPAASGLAPFNSMSMPGIVTEVGVIVTGESRHGPWWWLTAGGFRILDAARDWLRLESPPQRESLCPDNIKFLRKALEMCTSGCHPPAKTSFLPTRLLDLGADPASHTPRLIITADSLGPGTQIPAESVQYAALSYGWGSRADAAAQTKTEPSNLHQRLRAIPTHDISAVMQDAVRVCKALSVRYLWIDALCIIQDPADPSDWERESERVGRVYQHAYFTICALSTSNCHQSFLARSQFTFDLDFQSSLYPPAGGTYTLVCTGLHSDMESYNPLFIDSRSTWYHRGWVFQEHELSARKLLFGQHMVHFECGARQMSENDEIFRSGTADWSAAAVAKLSREKLYRQFTSATGFYAARQLSYESDRLPALSGVAKLVYDATGGKYLAGLWKEDLYHGLLWYGQKTVRQSLAERLDALRASTGSGPPSWSWVSQPGYFDYGLPGGDVLPGWDIITADRKFRAEYSNIDGWTVLNGAQLNPFGEVRSGTIRVQGKVVSMPADFVLLPRRTFPGHGIWKVYRRRLVVAYCYLDWAVVFPKEDSGRLEMLLLSSSCPAYPVPRYYVEDGDERESDEQDQEDNGDGYEDEDKLEFEDDPDQGSLSETEIDSSDKIPADGGLPPGSACSWRTTCRFCNNEKTNRHAWGLIIHPAEKPGEYYRVGIFMSPSTEGGTRLFKDAKERNIDVV